MSKELESARAMVTNLESFGVDGAGYDETERDLGSRQVRQPRSADHVSGHQFKLALTGTGRLHVSCLSAVFVFVKLGFCGHDLM
jgi:hypothetical protein